MRRRRPRAGPGRHLLGPATLGRSRQAAAWMAPVSDGGLRLHASMAGNGDPFAVLTPRRLALLFQLHEAQSEGARTTSSTPPLVGRGAELAPLVEAHLIVE